MKFETNYQFSVLLTLLVGGLAIIPAHGALNHYDAAIITDAAGGLVPVAKLSNAVTFNDANRAGFNFGNTSGDVTMEFIVGGDPVAGGPDGYLAVGANASSNLRFEQWSDTGQLGFTQLGVADYVFSPVVPSPTIPVHLAYVWKSAAHTMDLYVNGSLAGTRGGVDPGFSMPTGQGWLGNNGSSTEGMVGTIYRLTVYDDVIPPATIQGHADAYNGVQHPPILLSFVATPPAVFAPGASALTWSVTNAVAIFINGSDVTTLPNLTVRPSATTIYELIATNAGGSVTGQVTVLVDPAPSIQTFVADNYYVGAGQNVNLSWGSSYGESFFISPGVGDVTAQTVNGSGHIAIQPGGTTAYTLEVTSSFGVDRASLTVNVVHPANHIVISEFLANNDSISADEDGQFSDWIEIFNPTTTPLSLLGYFLTDNKDEPTRWAFPDVTLAGGAYLVVWASGKNRVDPAGPLHTNFQLDQAGEYLALIGPGPVVVQEFAPTFPEQDSDVSYGVLGGDPGMVRFMGRPTPGAQNDPTPAPPAKVLFSRGSGMFTNGFGLTLTTAAIGATIRYTLDGSAPSASNGTLYTAPISISGTRRVRAVAVKDGQTSKITGESYIRLAADLANYTSTLPMLVIENFGAGVIPQKGWSGNGSGIKQLPRQAAVWATFERQAGVTAFTNAPQMFSDVGIRGRGAYSSTWRQKPYSVEVLDAAGNGKSVSPLGLPAHEDWVLYFPDPDSNKDPSLLFNTFAYELYRNAGHDDGVRFRWVEAFINENGGDLSLSDRRGVYAIMDKVSRGKDRLNYTRLSADGTTGGWLLDLNRMDAEPETGFPAPNGATQPQFFHTAGPNRILQTPPNAQVVGDDEPQQSNGYLNFDDPGGYEITPVQRASIENWFKRFEDVLWNNGAWRDPVLGYRKYLDPVDFADFFILNVITHNGDGLLISMFPWKGDDDKLRMGPAWDYNWSAYYISGGPTSDLLWRSDQLWYRRLFADPDFMQLYIDRWWDLRRGPMSNAGMHAIIDGQVSDISAAKAVLNGYATTNEWLTNVSQMKTWLKTRADWIDSNYLRPPIFSQDGGDVPDGYLVTIFGANGTIYFTTDGTDPRAPGGAVAPSAQAFTLPFAINAQTMVQARIRVNSNWSGLTRAVFYPPQDLTKLVITEIMYNPPAVGATPGDEFEFIEFKNVGTDTLHLGTLTFTTGIDFTFTNGTQLGPGQFFVLARNAAALAGKYPGLTANGVYAGRLDNAGETLRLSTPAGSTVLSLTYDDRAPWPLAADGYGFSAVPKGSLARPNSDDGAEWRASSAVGGSPGRDDPAFEIAPILINEVLTHTRLPEVDWIELFNPNAVTVDIGGWFLSDDGGAPKKFRIPNGTLIAAGGYRVFSEADFNNPPGALTSFSLDSAGDAVYLLSGDASTNLTGYSHGFIFGAAADGVSFGRYVNSVGVEQFPAQLQVSRGGINSGPRVGPVVLSEIQYHPEPGGDEFIELRNITSTDQPLFDSANPTNRWRVNGLGYTFPANVTLPALGRLLVVGNSPAAFRTRYGVPGSVQIFGPFSGNLQDSGERLELQRPEVPGSNGVDYITVDAVRYNDKAPWPPAADGSGASLQRKNVLAYGDDPINWEAARPTPGTDYSPGQAPILTAQPQNRVVVAGQTASFQVAATGAPPLFYQWFFNNALVPNATNSTLTLASAQVSQAGGYAAVVFNEFGSAASSVAQLTVYRPPTILAQPTNQLIRPSSNAVFSVTAIGSGFPTYQWRLNDANIAFATNATLLITNSQSANEGAYTVVITDQIGSTTSLPAMLTLLIDPLVIQQPLSQSVLPGSVVVLSLGITNTATLPIGVRLRRNGSLLPATLPGAFLVLTQRTAFITLSGTNTAPPWTNYSFVITNMARPAGLVSSNALLTYLLDSDGDGLPDEWETANGLAPNDPSDAMLDTDLDGASNLREYLAGTDPNSAASQLKIAVNHTAAGANISFLAASNHTYTVQFVDALGSSWHPLADIVAQATNRIESILDPGYTTNRFYRLVTPQQR